MMGKSMVKSFWSALVIVTLTLSLAGFTMATEQVEGEAVDAAVAVDVITDINRDTRVITLKNEAGEYYAYTAGPEVKNFDQLKRGDLVIMEYYSGFAFALEPKGSGLEAKASTLTVKTAKLGQKPGVEVTGRYFVAAEIAGIDLKNGVVVLEGVEHVVALKVSDEINLSKLEVGEEVEALYATSYAISVTPAPQVSGTVKMKTKAVAVGIGVSWGEGTLSMYDGSEHEFSVRGLTLIDVGVSSVEATGEVYNLVEAKDLEGVFVAGEAGASLIGGGSVLALKNGNDVVMKLKTTQKGVRLSLAGQGLKVKLK
ncbi:EipA family protein [Desulfopila sp. IMCC35008]|uniref:EipA family protein n=1 Tax=Desulfopila sp. IMCC35008 TaxID=2653858 RepID=UPI0013D679AB|nr:EipA family protein [Desulfopila sp. IMCC35008]